LIRLDSFTQDLRYGARQLLRSPGFTVVAVLSLALGIGANTAIFQLVDAVRLRTLPVQDPQDVVYINFAPNSARSGWWSSRSATFTSAHWQQIQSQQQAFTGVLAWSATRFNLAQGGEVRYAEGLYVNADFFRNLGVPAVLGRTFTAEDDTPTCNNPGAVISYAFWQREFGGEPAALSRTVSLDGRPFPVIGVTPESFFGVEVGNRYEVAIPLCADQLLAEDKTRMRAPLPTAWWLSIMGRLKPGWSVERANAHLQTLSPGIMRATLPPTYRPDGAKRYLENKLTATQGGTGVSGLRRQYERPLWLLLAISGLVLLIACANLANLLLARASVREREIAVRLAIGASRRRLVRQLLSESLLLAVLGAAFGAVLAQVLSRGLVAFLTTTNNRLFVGLGIDWRVLSFTAALAVTTCLLFGLLPAVRATHLAPASAMRAGARGATAGRERFGLRRALVSTQVALSLVLLVGALLFVRSLQKLLAVDPGFHSEGILAVSLDLRRPNYAQERRPVIYRDLLQRISTRPGVVSAAQVGMTPVSGSGWNQTVRPEGAGSGESGKNSYFNRVGPGYFRTMGTTLIAGRDFDDRDTVTSPQVAIVNEAFAKTFFGGANPVGRSFRYEAGAGEKDPVFQIVGLVKNTKYYQLREDPLEIGFFPIAQDSRPGAGANYVIRASGSIGETMRHVTSAVGEVSPAIGIEFRPLSRQIKESLMRDRLMATLSGSFGLIAGLLATLGLYGVMSYMVARRRNEIGVRIALGADRGRVIGMVLREAGLLLAVGLAAGLLLAVWAARAAATLLFGLQPHDPVTLISAALLLAAVALAASYGPARRAAALEPMQALRDE
jgi:putative ABC transport system permease protein